MIKNNIEYKFIFDHDNNEYSVLERHIYKEQLGHWTLNYQTSDLSEFLNYILSI